jgi:integrase
MIRQWNITIKIRDDMFRVFCYHQNMKCANPIDPQSDLYRDFRDALTPIARLAWDTAVETGLRVSDVLQIRPDMLRPKMPVCERKTGKWRIVTLSPELIRRLWASGDIKNSPWCFPSATDPMKPMSRDTLGAMLRRVNDRVAPQYTLSMHSARKIYALNLYRRTGDYSAVQRDLQHEHLSTTLLYIHAAPMAR